jgi:prevent-host-death family protein
MSMDRKVVPAGEFKQGCLALLDEVEDRHAEIVITKRGRPVARLVPMLSDAEREAEILAGLRGSVKIRVPERELLRPTGDEAGWVLEPGDVE